MRKIAMITGGAKGIGREIALTLSKDGYDVIVTYNSSKSQAESLKQEIDNNGGYCFLIKCDISKKNEIDNMFSLIFSHFKNIDVLVNNAGISLNKLLIDTSYDEILNILNVNLASLIEISKIICSKMLERHCGNIINISSIWGECGASMESVYSASKAGIIGFTKALAKELSFSNIKVNAIAPGAIETDMISNLSDDEKRELSYEIPLQRIGKTDDVAQAVLFLLKSSYITGQVISVNGGLYI